MLSWIATPTGLARDPLTKRAAQALGIGVPQMIGHLQILWSWTLEFAPGGDLSNYSSQEIGEAAAWDGDGEIFVQALMRHGWLEDAPGGAGPEVVGWYEIGGRLIEAREKDRLRKREARSQPKPDGEPPRGVPTSSRYGAQEVRRTSGGHPQEVQSTNKQTYITNSTDIERESVQNPPAPAREERPVRALSAVPKSHSTRRPSAAEKGEFLSRFKEAFPKRNGILAGPEKIATMLRSIPPENWERVLCATRNYARSPDVQAGYVMHAYNWLESWEEWEHYEPPPVEQRSSGNAVNRSGIADARQSAAERRRSKWDAHVSALTQSGEDRGQPPEDTRTVLEGTARPAERGMVRHGPRVG